jgi:hypothetical protein
VWPSRRNGIPRRQQRLELALQVCGEERLKRMQPEIDSGAVRHGLPALWCPVDEGKQQELRFACSGQVHGLRDGRARLRQQRSFPALDAHELVHPGGAFGPFHDIHLRQVAGDSEAPSRFSTYLSRGNQLRSEERHLGSSCGDGC